MMELSLKSKCIKKRKNKKKKIIVPESDLLPLIKVGDSADGKSNWLKIQKTVESVKGNNSSNKHTKRKMIKSTGISQDSKDYRPPFNHKASQNSKCLNKSSRVKYMQTRVKKENACVARDSSCYINDQSTNLTLHDNDNTTSKEDKSQSYQFKFKESANSSPAKRNSPETERYKDSYRNGEEKEKKITKVVAMDCEMVGTGPTGEDSIIARVSIVNSYGNCLYDEFVKNKEKVTDFRTQISGVRPSDLKNGKDLYDVQKDVLNIIEGRILVGHSIKHDLDVLFLNHPRHLIRDTAYYKPFRDIAGGRTPSLKKLTSKILGCDIQSGEHSSVEDAQAAMLLYLRQRREWESLVKSQKKRKPKLIQNQCDTL